MPTVLILHQQAVGHHHSRPTELNIYCWGASVHTVHVLGVSVETGSHLALEWVPINSQSAPHRLISSEKNRKSGTRLQFKPKTGRKAGMWGLVKSMLLLSQWQWQHIKCCYCRLTHLSCSRLSQFTGITTLLNYTQAALVPQKVSLSQG